MSFELSGNEPTATHDEAERRDTPLSDAAPVPDPEGSIASAALQLPLDSVTTRPADCPPVVVYLPTAMHEPATGQEIALIVTAGEVAAFAGSAAVAADQLPEDRTSS
jgi:hypothetical protein